jgi:hypothetical protein
MTTLPLRESVTSPSGGKTVSPMPWRRSTATPLRLTQLLARGSRIEVFSRDEPVRSLPLHAHPHTAGPPMSRSAHAKEFRRLECCTAIRPRSSPEGRMTHISQGLYLAPRNRSLGGFCYSPKPTRALWCISSLLVSRKSSFLQHTPAPLSRVPFIQ